MDTIVTPIKPRHPYLVRRRSAKGFTKNERRRMALAMGDIGAFAADAWEFLDGEAFVYLSDDQVEFLAGPPAP